MKKHRRQQQHHHKPKRGTIPARIEELIGSLATGPLIFILVIIFIVGLNMTVRNLILHEKTEQVAQQQVTKQLAPLEAAVSKVTKSDGDSTFTAGEGQEFLILNISITQNLKRPIWLSPLQQSYVTDAEGSKYTLSPVGMDNPFDAHEYQSEEKAEGEVSYLVKKDTTDLEWCYELAQDNAKVCQKLD